MDTLEALIVVKAYPNPSLSLSEAVCMLGINRELGFVRLYPIPFRDLADTAKFAKYQEVRMKVRAPRSDKRPNTFRPDIESIEPIDDPLPTKNKWQARRDWVLPLLSPSMCELQRQQEQHNVSMGVFQPAEVYDILQEEAEDPEWSEADLAKLSQQDLFRPNEKDLLEKLPFRWRYHYRCADPDCKGHRQQIIDWEIGAFYRNLKRDGITDAEAVHEQVRQRFLREVCGPEREVYFFTGNMARRPQNFLILGVFWPPKDLQGTLF